MVELRRSGSIIKATALEILSEPLTLLVLLAALAMTTLAPAFHYHQFGDPTRMARDAGFSALFTCGSVIAVFGTIRAFRREVETGTLEMALAHPVSRTSFFLAKAFGALAAYLVFAVIVFGTTLTIFRGAEVGGEIARRTGDIAGIFGPFLAAGVAVAVVPLVLGAGWNRFAGGRFVLSALTLALALAVLSAGVALFLSGFRLARLLPVAVLVVLMALPLLSAAAAFSIRLRANAAASAVGIVFALLLPTVGNYYLVGMLADGGAPSWGYVGLAAVATAPAVAAFLLLGVHFINGRDIQWTT